MEKNQSNLFVIMIIFAIVYDGPCSAIVRRWTKVSQPKYFILTPHIYSEQCNTDDYGQMGWPICTPEEQMAVSCFDKTWEVDVQFEMRSKRKHKMFCPVSVSTCNKIIFHFFLDGVTIFCAQL